MRIKCVNKKINKMEKNKKSEEVANELLKLNGYQAICIDALNCLQENHP